LRSKTKTSARALCSLIRASFLGEYFEVWCKCNCASKPPPLHQAAPCERYCGEQATGDFVLLLYIENSEENHEERLEKNMMNNFTVTSVRVHLGAGACTPRLQARGSGFRRQSGRAGRFHPGEQLSRDRRLRFVYRWLNCA
jgi:hypothetical protein